MVTIPEWLIGGFIALALIITSLAVFNLKRFQENVVGIPENVFQGFGWGVGFFSLFFIMMKIIPALAIAVPTVPQAVMEFSIEGFPFALGTFFSTFIIIIIFPWSETTFKISIFSLLVTLYKLPVGVAVTIVSLLFASLHIFAYGILISASLTFGVLFQQIQNISGLLLTAGLFGSIATFLMLKTRNILWIGVVHTLINAVIVTTTLAIIAFA